MERPEIYPMDLRPQGHDIISFWLFHTVIKCYEHTGEVPFDATMINGMVLDENREKMSKSKGNVVDPDAVLEEYPVDAARFWAAGSAIGDDLPYQEKGLRAGGKLLRKLWNASKLVDSLAPEAVERPDDLAALDRWLLAELDAVIEETTAHLADRAFSKARDTLRSFFWSTFCDDYLEIAKQRLDEGEDLSATYTLRTAHERFLRLFAPLLAHATEELYHDMYAEESIHHSAWPTPLGIEADREGGTAAMAVVGALRKYKSDRQLPLNAPLADVAVYGPIEGFTEDVRGVMHVEELTVLDSEPEIESVITEIKLDYGTVGPEYGSQVPELEAGIEAGEYDLVGEDLHVAGETLGADSFEVHRERRYVGEGEMLEAGDAIVIVREE
jgi:valyl-tRNA synthetase